MMRFLGLLLITAIACTGCKPPTGDSGTSGTPSTNETTTPAVTNEPIPPPTATETPTEKATPAPEEKPEMKEVEPVAPMETPKEEPAPAPEATQEEMKAEEVNPETAAQPTPADEVEGLTDKPVEEAAPKEESSAEKAPEETAAEKPAPEEGAKMTKPAEETATVAAEASGPVETKLTAENTLIQFVGTHKGDKPDPRTGKFGKFSGVAKAAEGKLTEITVVIDTASLETDIEKLTNHLKSPDFFDVRQNPEAKFASKSIEIGDDGTAKVTGDLTLLGETKSISFPAKVKVGKDIALDAEFVINRVDFGMDYGTDNVHEDVTMTIKVGK
ncbi:YceI family protein [Bremerella sp.]|uniref:YceI family protein n=1 Tax=Bremerella sp. TaxID=2795602 RepID=UPI003919E2FE